MNLPISLLVLAAIGQAADSKLPPASKTTDVNKTNKRDLYEGNYGLRNGLTFGPKFGPPPGIEYAEHSRDDPSDKSVFGDRVRQISKISDVLTGQGPSFEEALANHLYSPVSVYHPRISSPTTFDTPPDASQLGYPKRKPYKQRQQHFKQYEENPQNNEPKPGYRPEYSHEESKLLHLETAFPRLEPSFSTPAPISQEIFIQNLPNINGHLYPHFSYQHVEQIPFRYPDGTLQPMRYVKQSLVKLVPVQSEASNGEVRRDQENQPTERPEVQISTEASNEDYDSQPQEVPSYANFFQNQPYAPSQQYLPVPRLSHIQPQGQYQLDSVQQSPPQPDEQLVQIPRGNQYQQYQQYQQTEETLQPQITQQEVEISQTTPQPDGQYHSTEEIPAALPTEPETPQPETISTFEPFSEHLTTPKLLETEVSITTVAPYTTHKPISRMPMAPLRPLPGSKRLPPPRPFSNTQPTTVPPIRLTTFSPLPAFRRYPHLITRQPTSPTFSTTFSSLPTITSTPQPDPTEILSTQSSLSTEDVTRTPIIRIRQKPSYNKFRSTTPQPTRPDVTTLEILSQPTTTLQPSTTLEQITQSDIQTKQPDTQLQGLEYLAPPELPSRPQPGVIYHLQSQSLSPTSPQPELLYPETYQIQPSPQPQLQVYPQPLPHPQSYREPILIQPSLQQHLHHQSVLPLEHIQLYQPPVFNLRPQYQPLSTPLPPLLPAELLQPTSPQPQLRPRPDAQEPKKLKQKSKDLKEVETYLPPRTIFRPQLYSQSHEVLIHPHFHHSATPAFTSVQYFGNYAQSIFGRYH